MTEPIGLIHLAEPTGALQARPPLVIDCSVLAGLLFEEPWMSQAEATMLGRDLQAPFLMQVEIAHVALKKQRGGFTEVAAQGLARFALVEMALHEVQPESVFALARRYELSAYDACYLWLAGHLKCPLATFDRKLGEAARAHLASLA